VRRLSLLAALGISLSSSAPPGPAEPPPRAVVPPRAEAPTTSPLAQAPLPTWPGSLAPLRFVEVRSHTSETVRLYADTGELDPEALVAVDRVAAAASGDPLPPPMNRRLLQLVVKAAAHFDAHEVSIVSTYRDGARPGSRHRMGEAMDFSFAGVSAMKLAQHLRTYARVGVGVYTNRRTQFVHLDVRDASYHWADASPPGRVWRESRMTDRGARDRDAAYQPEQDLPDVAR